MTEQMRGVCLARQYGVAKEEPCQVANALGDDLGLKLSDPSPGNWRARVENAGRLYVVCTAENSNASIASISFGRVNC